MIPVSASTGNAFNPQRARLNDKLVAENFAEGRDAQAFCLDKAA